MSQILLEDFLEDLVSKTLKDPDVNMYKVLAILQGQAQFQPLHNLNAISIAQIIISDLTDLGEREDAQRSTNQMSEEDRESLSLADFLAEYAPGSLD